VNARPYRVRRDGGRGCTNRGADARPGADEETAVANRLARVTPLVLHVPHPILRRAGLRGARDPWTPRTGTARERCESAEAEMVPASTSGAVPSPVLF